VSVVRAEVLEERIAPITRVKRISELGTLAVTSNVLPSSLTRFTLTMGAIRSSETSVINRGHRYHIPEDDVLQNDGLFIMRSLHALCDVNENASLGDRHVCFLVSHKQTSGSRSLVSQTWAHGLRGRLVGTPSNVYFAATAGTFWAGPQHVARLALTDAKVSVRRVSLLRSYTSDRVCHLVTHTFGLPYTMNTESLYKERQSCPCDQLTKLYERFEVITAVTMKNGVFWYVTPSGSCMNRRFGGT
jgi:hypothetical protein